MALKSTRPPPPPASSGRAFDKAPRGKAAPASTAARIAELEAKLAHEHRVNAALREVGLALGATLDQSELLELILAKITDAVEADRATLYLLDETGEALVSRVIQGGAARSIRLRVGQGIAGHVAQTGKALLVRDAYEDPRFNPEQDKSSGYRTRSILAVPMTNHLGKTIGVVQVLNKLGSNGTPAAFTEADAVTLAALATQAAVSIDLARLFWSVTQKNAELTATKEQLEHRVRDLKLLFDLESAMGRAASLEQLFDGVLREACAATGAVAGAFAVREGGAGLAQLYVYDANAESLRRVPIRPSEGFAGAAMSNGEIVFTGEALDDPRRHPALDEVLGFACTAVIAVPLEGEEDEPFGAVCLYNKVGAAGFSEEDRALLLLIAANASTAIRLMLARDAREREERLTTIGRLLSGVLHDLKTPLTIISGYVQLMEHADDKAQRAEYSELALKQFEHIVAMQRDVLEFARGEKSLLIRKVYLVQFFDDVRRQLEAPLAKGGVELVVDVKDRGTARFDEGKILRVVQNLARNAMEAMATRSGGKLVITVARHKGKGGEELVLTFTDNGPGIPKDIEHRLFESFVTSGKQGGTGLGLAITKRVTEEHGGTVSVKSTSKGATFTLRLPQAAPHAS